MVISLVLTPNFLEMHNFEVSPFPQFWSLKKYVQALFRQYRRRLSTSFIDFFSVIIHVMHAFKIRTFHHFSQMGLLRTSLNNKYYILRRKKWVNIDILVCDLSISDLTFKF